jgi:predicted nucleotidyltransferase
MISCTTFPGIDLPLEGLVSRIRRALGEKLVGLYLYGSLVTGDFDLELSDIDLTAALTTDVDDVQSEALRRMHADFVAEYTEWDDRIEVCYVSLEGLATVASKLSPVVNISPGEPLHRTLSRPEWLLDWHLIREESVSLYGPSARALIEPISREAFIQAVKEKSRAMRDGMGCAAGRGEQAYAILTQCRCLHACKCGKQVSKRQAALWVSHELPEWSALIKGALVWRQTRPDADEDGEATYAVTWTFVNCMVDLIAAE